jgi:hypothetical protein
MKDPGRGPARASTARHTCPFWGVWVGVERGGWGSVLGGLAHCWALRDQPVGWLLVASFGPRACDVCGWWLVGVLFEICIVDASIFVAIVVVLCL